MCYKLTDFIQNGKKGTLNLNCPFRGFSSSSSSLFEIHHTDVRMSWEGTWCNSGWFQFCLCSVADLQFSLYKGLFLSSQYFIIGKSYRTQLMMDSLAICSFCDSWSDIPFLLKSSNTPGIIFQKMYNFILQVAIPCPQTSRDPLYESLIGTCHMLCLPTSGTSHTTRWTRSYGPSVRAACTIAKTYSRALSCFATHLKLTVLSWILMWNALITKMEEAHRHSDSLSKYYILSIMIRCTAAAKSLQSCPTLCHPIDGSPPGSPVPGILQARTLEWVAISFSNAGKWKVKGKSLSRVQLFVTPWTAAHQAPPSMGFSRQEC